MTVLVPGQGETNLQRLVASIRQLAEGRTNSTGTCTLTAGATSTTVSFDNCAETATVQLMPMTANAAVALGGCWIVPANRSFVINHANTATTDRTFGFAIIG